jgi:membrane associated rhomboid family serine protease
MPGGADLFVVCKSCGSEVSPYITECPYCGTRLRKRAPRLDREGRPAERGRRLSAPSLGRLRPGEIPGVAADTRPFGAAALVVASIALTIAWRAGAVNLADVAVLGGVHGDWWRLLSAPFAFDNSGYQVAVLATVAIFGWLLERRHGTLVMLAVFEAGAVGGMAVAAAAGDFAIGANGGALALVCAWAMRDVLAARRGREVEGDLLGAGVIAALLLAMPLATDEASAAAGVTGLVAGAVLGLALARRRTAA